MLRHNQNYGDLNSFIIQRGGGKIYLKSSVFQQTLHNTNLISHHFPYETYKLSLKISAPSCPPLLRKIFILCNTCTFKSGLLRFCPAKPPYVLSNSNGLSAFQMARTAGGGRGIIFGYAHMKE